MSLCAYRPSVVVACISLLFSGCAQVESHRLDPRTRRYIHSTECVLAVEQAELRVDLAESGSPVGVLGALLKSAIDKARAQQAEELVTPIRDDLLDYDFANLLRNELDTGLRRVKWLKAGAVSLERQIGEDRVISRYRASKASVFLFMTAEFLVSEDFHSIEVRLSAVAFPKSDSLYAFKKRRDSEQADEGRRNPVDMDDIIYRNVFVYSDSLVDRGKVERDELGNRTVRETKITQSAAAQLASGHSSAVRKALDIGVVKVARMLVQDLAPDRISK